MTSTEYQILDETPTAQEHRHLRTVSGLTPPPINDESLSKALKNSVFVVVVRTSTGEAVGMGRVIGDGGLFMQVSLPSLSSLSPLLTKNS